MSELKFSPGPWILAISRKDRNFYYITAKDHTSTTPRDVKITSIEGGSHPDKEYGDRLEANAKLIAAAPDLLHTLNNLVFTAEKLWQEVSPIKSSEFFTITHPMIEEAKAAIKKATE